MHTYEAERMEDSSGEEFNLAIKMKLYAVHVHIFDDVLNCKSRTNHAS